MKLLSLLLCAGLASAACAEDLKIQRDIPYTDSADAAQKLDVYAPPGAKDLPVVVWIHGGGWAQGDKAEVQEKPAAFGKKGFVFVSVNYRLWPKVLMGDLIHDVAKSVGWVHTHAAEYGGDPHRMFIMGHSAGAQLAALLCTDERLLKAEGVPFSDVKGCVPVDGDTYNVPASVALSDTRCRVYNLPEPKGGHRAKFGNPEQQADYSAVNHVKKDKGIPPFLLLHVATHPDTTLQAQDLAKALKSAGVSVKVFGAKDTDHSKLNNNLGVEGDPATKELFEFVDQALK
ncbi:putative para-nitrobenzyl esterase [Chthoniobacter flavus Ellin428]|uniref:Putative para-nitrobenzyl esterase n=1 Tax=Chthoniobacter flavus Ellin428 TaxID=497964 RepID=B4D9A1_9BACT|nr:alpha/beta hydrolase [Chthoniobacter flavus]EDY17004.1 putative para-nitrobenzyl esterase [Chthoniobacter flavus Ellin428]TCO86089.1 acetyl esterase/lipase [Chthoniobacter flavus]